MGSHFFLRTFSIIGGDVMTILIIYLYVSCILIWYELITKRKYIKEQMEGIEELGSVLQFICAIFIMLLAFIAITPAYIYLGFKRLL